MYADDLKCPFRFNADAALCAFNSCKGGFRYKLITPKDRLLPFVFRYPSVFSTALPVSWTIYETYSNVQITTVPLSGNINVYKLDDYQYVMYKGATLGLNLDSGFYYSVVALSDGKAFTSEEFWVDCDSEGTVFNGDYNSDFNEDFGPPDSMGGLPKYNKLQWWHSCDIGNMIYQTGFENVLYFETDTEPDDPIITQEGQNDGIGDFVTSFIKYVEVLKLSEYVPHYVLNALMALPVHSNVLLTARDSLYVTNINRSTVTFKYEDACFATVELKLQQKTKYYTSQCCDNEPLVTLL